MRGPFANSAGLTVVEVVIALGVILVGLVALIAVMPLSTSLIGEASRKTTAAFLAQQRLEQIKNAKWNFAPAADCLGASASDTAAPVTASWANCPGATPPGLVTFPDEAYDAIAGYPHYQRDVRVRACTVALCGMATTTLRRVTVTVTFAHMTGTGQLDSATPETVRLDTLVARRP